MNRESDNSPTKFWEVIDNGEQLRETTQTFL